MKWPMRPESSGIDNFEVSLYYPDKDDGISQEMIVTEAGNYGRYYDNFYHALRSGGELLVKAEEAVDVLRIVEAAQKSQNQKKRISLGVIKKECKDESLKGNSL